MEWFLLFSSADLLVIIIYSSVRSCLLGIKAFQCIIEQPVIHLPDIFITVIDIQGSAFRVRVLRIELAAVMTDRSFTYHCTDGSHHIKYITSFVTPHRRRVLLLLSRVTQKHF